MNCNKEAHMGKPEEIIRLIRGADSFAFDSALLAGGWNLLSQAGLPCLLECQRRGVDVHVAGAYASGLIVGASIYAYRPAPAAMKAKVEKWTVLASKHGVALPAVALAFAFLPECVSRVVLGMASPEEVAQNMAWVKESRRVPD